jgi:hypothetical protein
MAPSRANKNPERKKPARVFKGDGRAIEGRPFGVAAVRLTVALYIESLNP